MPEPITEQAERVLMLWQGSWVAAFAVGILVWGLIIWSVIFHRKRSEQLPPQVRYNLPIEALYTVLPIVVIAVLFYFTARDQTYLLETDEPADTNIEVVGFQWSWQFNYLTEPNPDGEANPESQREFSVEGTPDDVPTLVVREGDVVHFDLVSPDVIHSFWIPSFAFKMDVIPGHPNEFQVQIKDDVIPEGQDSATFAGRCAELCGVDHARMLFNLEVMTPEAYDAWYAEQLQNAATEAEQQAARDEEQQIVEDPRPENQPATGDAEGGTATEDTPATEGAPEPQTAETATEEEGGN
ncbi:cytochrome c oxidase subunit II [Nocardiopsis sediminis]|uniref:cytochrome-c oxidase n=1 Tax=Nocardiopsis sediminis TaxID=1778267 RepID=A0ABV8FRL9_9ACTN